MTHHASAAYAWIVAHPAECWIALSAVLNLLLRVKSAERWVEHAERYRVSLAVLSLLRALGVDPAGAMRAVALLASSKAAGSSVHAILVSPPASDQSPPTPRNTGAP